MARGRQKPICRRLASAGLLLVLLFAQIPTVSRAADLSGTIAAMQEQEEQTRQQISDLEKQTQETQNAIKELQGQKEQTQSHVSSLVNQSHELQNTIDGYSDQLDDLSAEIGQAESELAVVSAEIVQLNKELQEARAEEEARYDALKKRMRAVYESGGTEGMMQVLLTSGSMQEMLTTAEYLSAVVQYDFKKIEEFRDLQADIEAKTAVVEEKEAELDAWQAQLDEDYGTLADLTDTVRGQLSSTNSSISSEKGKLANYEQQLTDLDGKMKQLESQTAAANAALARQIAERLALMHEDTSGSYAASADELTWLAATIQAEADGESYTGKLGVGSVIMNRVKSSMFPNTIVGVITQNMQFASYRSGKVELIISRGPNSTCIRAAQEVLNGARIGDYLFFMTKYYADYYGISEYTMIGNHAFFYRWVTNKPTPAASESTGETPAESTPEETVSENTEQDNGGSEESSSESPEESSEGGGEDNSDSGGGDEEGGNGGEE
ncbi:MAG: cell wall hydrolase [Lachnospiraceae bacterium]|nr:cell wall hydrolase [Lachnospiraceae bacterium]